MNKAHPMGEWEVEFSEAIEPPMGGYARIMVNDSVIVDPRVVTSFNDTTSPRCLATSI
jgi:hypothetical protein